MDTSKAVTHISLCSGYGGIDLGLKRAVPGLLTIAYSEIEAFACANLVAKMEKGFLDPAPIWTDLKTFPWQSFCGKVDILSGGYPCQPFSTAGGRKGSEDPRHLWPYIANGIRLSKPRICFFENVEGHISLGLSTVVSDLEEMGYKVSWGIFSASEVGAPHQRKRVFILADNSMSRTRKNHNWSWESIGRACGGKRAAWPSRQGELQYEWEPARTVENSTSSRCKGSEMCQKTNSSAKPSFLDDTNCINRGIFQQEWGHDKQIGSTSETMANSTHSGQLRTDQLESSSRHSCQQGGYDLDQNNTLNNKQSGAIESKMGGDSNGSSNWMGHAQLYQSCDNRTDELRLLGNGVIPATAYKAFVTLFAEVVKG